MFMRNWREAAGSRLYILCPGAFRKTRAPLTAAHAAPRAADSGVEKRILRLNHQAQRFRSARKVALERKYKHLTAEGRATIMIEADPGFVPEQLRIVHRPEDIAHRLMPGHREGGFIKGAFNRWAVGTRVERHTRFVVLCRMDGCTAQDALEGFTRQMGDLPAFLHQSLTYDRGCEMARHRQLAQRLKLDIWFADPHAPWHEPYSGSLPT